MAYIIIILPLIVLCPIAASLIAERRKKLNRPVKPSRIFSLTLLVAVTLFLIYAILMPPLYILRFDTPEQAYRFTHEMDCTHVVYGEGSALAIGVNEDHSTSALLMVKDGESWRGLSPFLYKPHFLTDYEGMSIYLWDKCPEDLYAVVGMTSVYPSSTKKIMLNDQATSAEIIEENKNINGYSYYLYYRLDGNAKEITLSVDGEPYTTVQVNEG